MRFVVHANNWPPRSRVGAWLATHQFVVGLLKAGHEGHVLTENRIDETVLDGLHIAHEGPFLAEYTRRADVAINLTGGSGYGHRAAIACEKPSVRFMHGAVHGDFKTFQEFIEFGGPAALVVFNSNSLAEMADYTGNQIVCHPPLRFDDYVTTPGESITLVNLTEEKGAELFSHLARYMPDRHFLGVTGGYGKQYDLWRRNLDVIDHTIDPVRDVYSKTRIIVMPSLIETWGMVAAEAMCSGIPVIAHPTPGLTELLGPAGIFADREDVDAWLDAIDRLDDPKVYAAQSKKCVKRAKEIQTDGEEGILRFVAAVEALV